MTLTRWKLLAGVFGLSAGGIAALAQPACKPGQYSNEHVVQAKATLPPVSIPQQMPAPDELVVLAPPQLAAPLPVSSEPVPQILALPVIAIEPIVEAPKPAKPQPIKPTPRLAVTTPAESPAVTAPVESPRLAPPSLPQHPVPTAIAPAGMVPAPLQPEQFSAFLQDMIRAGEPVVQPTPKVTLPSPFAVTLPVPGAVAPEAAKTTVQTTAHAVTVTVPAVADKKFKVLLQIGDTLPKFEIRDGEEVLLKVVADKVDVKSPVERSELWATLKAAGQVKFATPGGEGVCDELQVVPGSGEVLAVGNVKFTYNWGKVETGVTSERMTFRLGKAQTLTHAPTAAAPASPKDVKQIFNSHVGWIGGQ